MKIKNRLDAFQSHSVHYVMLAARSTEDVRIFTDGSSTAATASLQAIDNTKQLGEVVRTSGTGGSTFLMLDTRRFSQFTVENFSVESYIAGFDVPGSSSPHATAVNMTFNIIDNVGISFANFLQYLMDQKLQVSFDGMTILVRVLFIGHKADGTTEVVQSITIPAIFNQIEVELTDTRGVYSCKLFPLLGMPSNAGYNAKWTTIGNATAYFTGKNANTLGAMVGAFEQKLNDLSLHNFAILNGETQQPGQPVKTVGRYGRPVQYMITLPEKWYDYKFSGPVSGAATETNFAELLKQENQKKRDETAKPNATETPASDSYVGVSPEWTITEVLDKMFAQTVEVAQLANFTRAQTNTTSVVFYKHLVTITSDDRSFTVHVDVVEFEVPNVYLAESGQVTPNDSELYREEPATSTRAARKVPKNFLEFDYIFSGKNLDVLNLDLKIENLNWMLLQGTKLGSGELFNTAVKGQDQKDSAGVSADKRTVQGMRQKDPFLMPQLTPDQLNNFSNLAASVKMQGDLTPQQIQQQYTRNLSAFYNAGPVNAKLELRGNPDLMAGVALQQMPQHVSAITMSETGATSSINTQVKSEYRKSFEKSLLGPNRTWSNGALKIIGTLDGPSYLTSPVFVKVNVFGPNVDFITNEPIAGQDFAQKLFLDNYYFLSKINSKIEGTRFTHELELMSYSVYGYQTMTAQGPQSKVKPQEAK